MKHILIAGLAVLLMALLSSCGVSHALVINNNQNSTQVQLASNNFKVVDKVSASVEIEYIFMIGGTSKKQLFENAYSAMMAKANLMNGSKAVVNIVTEEHLCGFPPFYYKRTLTVSAHVIEFTH